MGETALAAGRDLEARELIERAIGTQMQARVDGHPDLAKSYEALARTLDRLGESDAAKDARARVEAIRDAV
jgi:hypothetical protein